MRGKFTLIALLSCLCVQSVYAEDPPAPVFGTDVGLVTFDGAVTDTTCKITSNNGIESNNVTVTMPTVKKEEVEAATLSGGGAGAKTFQLMLSDCTGVATATIQFSSEQFADLSNGTLKNDATVAGAAKNVSLALFNDSSSNTSQVLIGEPTDVSQSLNLSTTGSGAFAYKVAYVPSSDWNATSNPIESGKVESNMTFTLAYQ